MIEAVEIYSREVPLLKQVSIFVDAYYNDVEFQFAFGKDLKITRFQLYVIFLYFCSYNKLFGYPSQVAYIRGKLVGLINYHNEKNPLGCTKWDFSRFKIFKFLYRHILNLKIRERIDKYSEISYHTTRDLNTYDLCQIGVCKKLQGNGYIRNLIKALETLVKGDDKVDGMTVTTFSENKYIVYESLGFKLNKYTEDLDARVWILTKEVKA